MKLCYLFEKISFVELEILIDLINHICLFIRVYLFAIYMYYVEPNLIVVVQLDVI